MDRFGIANKLSAQRSVWPNGANPTLLPRFTECDPHPPTRSWNDRFTGAMGGPGYQGDWLRSLFSFRDKNEPRERLNFPKNRSFRRGRQFDTAS